MKTLVKRLDDSFFNEAIRRGIIHGRVLEGARAKTRLGCTIEAIRRERTLSDDSFLYRTETPRFVGGTTGRSGTKWLIRLMERELGGDPVVIGEHGMFVLSLFREAPYEYYQLGTTGAAQKREHYLDYFLTQVRRYAFRRRRLYGSGIKGMIRYVPRRAIDRAGEWLREELRSVSAFPEIKRCFGDFYLALHNYHAAVIRGASAGWVNKEPPYGRHADTLLGMVPHARLVVMARDGRASALSMYKRGWTSTLRGAMERWREFAERTVEAVERCPENAVLIVHYEDMVREFEQTLKKVFRHFEIPLDVVDRILSSGYAESLPRNDSLERWKDEIDTHELNWFEEHCRPIMKRLGY